MTLFSLYTVSQYEPNSFFTNVRCTKPHGQFGATGKAKPGPVYIVKHYNAIGRSV